MNTFLKQKSHFQFLDDFILHFVNDYCNSDVMFNETRQGQIKVQNTKFTP